MHHSTHRALKCDCVPPPFSSGKKDLKPRTCSARLFYTLPNCLRSLDSSDSSFKQVCLNTTFLQIDVSLFTQTWHRNSADVVWLASSLSCPSSWLISCSLPQWDPSWVVAAFELCNAVTLLLQLRHLLPAAAPVWLLHDDHLPWIAVVENDGR